MKLFTKTFGCQMNFADSDEMGRHLAERGYQTTADEAHADAILVNTCTVRDMAEHKGMSYIGRLREWKLANPKGLVIVTGCAAERAKADIRRKFPYVDLIVGAKDIEQFPRELEALLKIDEETLVPPALSDMPSAVIQYVTIMRGCNYSCSYCIVPSVRGREVYRPVAEILADVARAVDTGAKEIWLLGQTVNSYRPTGAPFDFSDLLREVGKAAPGVRLRFISPHPFYLNPRLIQAMAEVPEVCEHVHLPVQSGSDEMLRRMKRNYTAEGYLAGLKALRAAIPGIAITTDLIVGFPGETEEDFQKTLALVKEADFASAYCFKYSPRPGTASAEWADDVTEEEKDRRVNLLLDLTERMGQEKAAALIGTVQEVLIEEEKEGGLLRGKTRTAWRLRLKAPGLKIGDLVSVRITGSHSRELHGEVLHSAPFAANITGGSR